VISRKATRIQILDDRSFTNLIASTITVDNIFNGALFDEIWWDIFNLTSSGSGQLSWAFRTAAPATIAQVTSTTGAPNKDYSCRFQRVNAAATVWSNTTHLINAGGTQIPAFHSSGHVFGAAPPAGIIYSAPGGIVAFSCDRALVRGVRY
jgi:hypothetical protein